MQLPVMVTAKRDGEFVADFETQGSRLRKAQMVRIGGLAATDQVLLNLIRAARQSFWSTQSLHNSFLGIMTAVY